MKFTITLFALSFLLTGCGKHSQDVAFSHKMIGSWTDEPSSPGSMETRTDGSFLVTTPKATTFGGAWHIEDGFLVLVVTNAPIQTKHWKIMSIDDHKMIFRPDASHTNLATIYRK
jgi:hypothetical protein